LTTANVVARRAQVAAGLKEAAVNSSRRAIGGCKSKGG
jgi:hypothetical protein